jgi:uncharacterized protein (DUF362 family)
MDRREFIKKCISIAAISTVMPLFRTKKLLGAPLGEEKTPDIVAVRNGEPDKMFDAAIKAFGGMKKFVKKGQTVVVKPNIAWNSEPDGGACTNPILVKRVVEHVINAGAKKVYVFDHTCHDWESTYKVSGIENAAKNAGAIVVPAHKESYFEEVRVPGASILKTVKVHELILESDVFINVPILKHHGSTLMTSAMKNLMGVVWDRGFYHRNDLHGCISEFCLYRKPDLNILDAYFVMTNNGPMCYSKEFISKKKMQLISKDIVAIDAAGAKILGREPQDIKHVVYGSQKGLGNIDIEGLNIERIVL